MDPVCGTCSMVQPRQGRRNLARGASPWSVARIPSSPGGATYHGVFTLQLCGALVEIRLEGLPFRNSYVAPTGASLYFARWSRGSRPWLHAAAAPQLASATECNNQINAPSPARKRCNIRGPAAIGPLSCFWRDKQSLPASRLTNAASMARFKMTSFSPASPANTARTPPTRRT